MGKRKKKPTTRDRIKELRRVRAGDLIPNPKNWREHGEAQTAAMTAILDEVGIADAVLARETPDGLMLLDGHLRQSLDPDEIWPVLILDVTEAEADKILATHDPIAAMAGVNQATLDGLLKGIEFDASGLDEMIAGVLSDAQKALDGVIGPAVVQDEIPEPPADPIT